MASNKTDGGHKSKKTTGGARAHKGSPVDRSLESRRLGRGARLGGVRNLGEPVFHQPVIEKPDDDTGPETNSD